MAGKTTSARGDRCLFGQSVTSPPVIYAVLDVAGKEAARDVPGPAHLLRAEQRNGERESSGIPAGGLCSSCTRARRPGKFEHDDTQRPDTPKPRKGPRGSL